MKKWILIIALCVASVGLIGCGSKGNIEDQQRVPDLLDQVKEQVEVITLKDIKEVTVKMSGDILTDIDVVKGQNEIANQMINSVSNELAVAKQDILIIKWVILIVTGIIILLFIYMLFNRKTKVVVKKKTK